MPLSMTLNRSKKTPLVTPYFDGKELHIDSELVNSGLSAISVKGCDAGDPRLEVGIRHRNSFWSVHRPELSKLNWVSDYTPQNIENYLKVQAGNDYSNKGFNKSGIPLADLNQLTVIHADSNQREETDENYLLMSKPQTTQLSDDDLASHTTLHKSRAEFCVTIGHLGEQSTSGSSEQPSGSKIVHENSGGNSSNYKNDEAKHMVLQFSDGKIENVFQSEAIAPIKMEENEKLTAVSKAYNRQSENLGMKQTDEKLASNSQEMLIVLMDDTAKDS